MKKRVVLSTRNLTKKYALLFQNSSIKAVDSISFDLYQGEILGLLGPNGSGKTTTLQMLLGVLTPTSGEISYFGRNFSQHKHDLLDQINFSSPYVNFPLLLTIDEILLYSSFLYTIPDRRQRIEEVIEQFGLQSIRKKQVKTLSTGQNTRLSLAKAFINHPKILLLDEPTAALDPEIAHKVRQYIQNLSKRFRTSIIIASHNMAEVTELCYRVVFLRSGKIYAIDKPDNLSANIGHVHITFEQLTPERAFLSSCAEIGISMKKNRKSHQVAIEENQLSNFLRILAKNKVSYQKINITKSTLEEYFIKAAQTS